MECEPTAIQGLKRPRELTSGERGAIAVEFGLMLLVLITLLAGVADFSSLHQAKRDISDAARAGARAGAQACIADATCVIGNPNDADVRVQSAIQEFLGIRSRDIERLIIFRAGANDSVPAPCLASSSGVTGDCNVTTNPFGVNGEANTLNMSSWPSTSRSRDESLPDYIGVHIIYRHHSPVGLFGPTPMVTARATFRLEPPILANQTLDPLDPLAPTDPFPTWWCDYTINCGYPAGPEGPAGPETNPSNGAG
jgi:Flp pilus assembly protein TadG